jgi:alcohol dehydrogenase YqhD (iron-dependent ADH family)
MNSGAVITNWTKHEKLFFGRKETFPVFSILNPENLYSLPKDQTAYGIIDTYSHVLEQYITTSENVPLQDRFGEGILLTLIENAQKSLSDPQDYVSRANIMLSACMALNGLIRSGTNEDWATHRIEHEISAFYDIPHAAGLAIITPRWMNVATEQKGEKIVQYGRRIWNLSGTNGEIIRQAITKTYEFFSSLGVKMNLGEWGITKEHFPEIIERLVDGKVGETPLSRKQIETILDNCLV